MTPSFEETSNKDEGLGSTKMTMGKRQRLKLLVISSVAIIVICLAIGLGVGLTAGGFNNSNDDSSPSTSSNQPLNAPNANFTTHSTSPMSYRQPTSGLSWNYVLEDALNSTATDSIAVWGIDLFNNDASIVSGLQSNGAKVICYLSAVSYEVLRPDANNFTEADLGKDLSGWQGERWLNLNSSNVRNIMLNRLNMAYEKNCDGVDPDNVDGYANDNGLGLISTDSINYVEFLANEAHARNLSLGLKNAGAIIPNVIDGMQWSVNEQCVQYNECSTFAPFIQQGKPVFHVEYPEGATVNNDDNVDAATQAKYCTTSNGAEGFSTILKNILLDSWIEQC
jgi:hypothetical protein